jgi:hypothetical protein
MVGVYVCGVSTLLKSENLDTYMGVLRECVFRDRSARVNKFFHHLI